MIVETIENLAIVVASVLMCRVLFDRKIIAGPIKFATNLILLCHAGKWIILGYIYSNWHMNQSKEQMLD